MMKRQIPRSWTFNSFLDMNVFNEQDELDVLDQDLYSDLSHANSM